MLTSQGALVGGLLVILTFIINTTTSKIAHLVAGYTTLPNPKAGDDFTWTRAHKASFERNYTTYKIFGNCFAGLWFLSTVISVVNGTGMCQSLPTMILHGTLYSVGLVLAACGVLGAAFLLITGITLALEACPEPPQDIGPAIKNLVAKTNTPHGKILLLGAVTLTGMFAGSLLFSILPEVKCPPPVTLSADQKFRQALEAKAPELLPQFDSLKQRSNL